MGIHTWTGPLMALALASACGGGSKNGDSSDMVEEARVLDLMGTSDVGRSSDVQVMPDVAGDTPFHAPEGIQSEEDSDVGLQPADLTDSADSNAGETMGSLAPPCCGEGGACPEGLECVPGFLGGPPACLPPATGVVGPESCWSDLNCPPELACAGSQGCSCQAASCDIAPVPGACSVCVCCGADDDCPEPMICVGMVASGQGVCIIPPQPGEGQCSKDEDCEQDEACIFGSEMSCSVPDCGLHPPGPGSCQPAWKKGCCDTLAWVTQCMDDEECVPWPASISEGKCGPKPAPGQCYEQMDCPDPDSMMCQDVVTCLCQEGGEACIPSPGKCVDVPWNPCCALDEECQSGYCAVTSDDEGTGTCLEKPDAGKCWVDGDCNPGESCAGEFFCSCATECPEDDMVGKCVVLPGGCCNTVADCAAGEACIGPTSELPGRCLADSEGSACTSGDCCWTVADCPPVPWDPSPPYYCAVCLGGSFCPCVEACPDCQLDCPVDQMGSCGTVQCM